MPPIQKLDPKMNQPFPTRRFTGLGTAVLWLACGLLWTTPVAALTGSAVSTADTLDSRAPLIQILSPGSGDTFNSADPETLRWTIDEQSWDLATTPISWRIETGGGVLGEGQVAAQPGDLYNWIWEVPLLDSTPQDARVIVQGQDRFGWSAADTSALFVVQDLITDVPAFIGQNHLGPVFPNPFNPRTEIAFRLRASARARLTVYDLRGRQVITLVDEVRAAGSHQAQWNGRDAQGQAMPSGAYFARLQLTGPNSTTSLVTRLTLVK